jgi:signal transduction histidine kinase
MVAIDESLTYRTLDGILLALPVHVLCFDHDLVCRYAAPHGSHFLGCSRDELRGRRIDHVFPDGMALRPYLETVLHTNQPWRAEWLPYPAGPNGAWLPGAWTVHAQPFAAPVKEPEDESADRNRGRRHRLRVRLRPAVLVSLSEHEVRPEDGDYGTGAREPLPAGSSEAVDFAAGGAAERHRAAMLLERVRTKLTVIRGFSQLLRRRIHRVQPGLEVEELNRITEAIGELDGLIDRYERSERREP